MTPTQIVLDPCPFCGFRSVYIAEHGDGFVARCQGCSSQGSPSPARHRAAEFWNTRQYEGDSQAVKSLSDWAASMAGHWVSVVIDGKCVEVYLNNRCVISHATKPTLSDATGAAFAKAARKAE